MREAYAILTVHMTALSFLNHFAHHLQAIHTIYVHPQPDLVRAPAQPILGNILLSLADPKKTLNRPPTIIIILGPKQHKQSQSQPATPQLSGNPAPESGGGGTCYACAERQACAAAHRSPCCFDGRIRWVRAAHRPYVYLTRRLTARYGH
ncbi:hypothetical protein L208DRAFT_317088 [Tricholoma matsutake]|nr:hypothetical protein L208DRAFT_317088 [Tricholoma matsutake 945]